MFKNSTKHESIATCSYIKLRKELNSKIFLKRIYLPILKETIFFRPIRVLTSLGVAIVRVTLHDRALILKRQQFLKMK